MGFFSFMGNNSSKSKQVSNANKGKDASKGDHKKGNTKDNSKTHTRSNPGLVEKVAMAVVDKNKYLF
jgi:hypothetical protein